MAVGAGSSIDARPLTAEDAQLGSLYGYVPVSVSIRDDRLVLHLNVGARYEKADGHTRATWGVPGELAIVPRLYAIAETYGSSGETPFGQAGVRVWLWPNRVQCDTTYGSELQSGTNDRVTVGLRFLSPPFS